MLIMSLEDNWAMTTPMGQGDYSFIPHPKDGQSHDVNEDVVAGDVIAQIELDSESFFAFGLYEHEWSPYELALANAIPGDPITLSNSGEVIVNNPAAFDFDAGNTQYQLEVIGNQGNTYTAVATVTLNIHNVNDIAPSLMTDIPAMTVEDQQMVTILLADYFTDLEGM